MLASADGKSFQGVELLALTKLLERSFQTDTGIFCSLHVVLLRRTSSEEPGWWITESSILGSTAANQLPRWETDKLDRRARALTTF